MNASRFTILLVSSDRGTLRRLTASLTMAGHRVQQTLEREQAAALLAVTPPDVLILDASSSLRPMLDLLQSVDSDPHGCRPYTLVIVDNPSREDLIAAVEAGANDFLTTPVVNGELLARVQAGRQFQQCERYMPDMAGGHAVTGLPGFSALEHRLRRELSRPGRKDGTPSLVAVDLDFYQVALLLHGKSVGTAILRAAGQALHDIADGVVSVYTLGGDRFAVLLPGVAEDGAVSWAKLARKTLAELDVPIKGQNLRISASCGVTGSATEEDPERLIWNVLEALRSAKSSGRDCVARFGEFLAESAGDDAAMPLSLLQDSVARNIFIPCSLALRADDRLAEAAALFRRTRLPAFPVVDGKGEVAGLLHGDAVRDSLSRSAAAKVADSISADVAKFDERTDFFTLLQHFAQYPEAVAVVVRDGRPTGLLTSDCLVTLVNSGESYPVTKGNVMARECPIEVASL
jgi:two-component system, cell cycle response regulator